MDNQFTSYVPFRKILRGAPALSSVHRLSHDVRHHLFAICNRTIVDPNFPIVLSQVCQDWRFTALCSPSLWTKIKMSSLRAKQQHPWVHTRLARSRRLPVKFHLRATRPLQQYELDTIITIHAHRFRQFVITGSNYHLTILLWKQLNAEMPLLEHFEFRVYADMHIIVFRDAAQGIAPFCLPRHPRHQIEWSQWDVTNVTSLTLNYLGPEIRPRLVDVWNILLCCKNSIQHLEIRGFAPWRDHGQVMSQVVLQRLQSLTIGYFDNFAPLVDLIAAPRLQFLSIRDAKYCPESWIEREWTDFAFEQCEIGWILNILATCTSITHVELFGIGACQPHAAVQFMEALTKLKSLTLYGCHECFIDPFSTLENLVFPALSNLIITDPSCLAPFLSRRTARKLPLLDKLTISESCLVSPGFSLETLGMGVRLISKILDPLPLEYRPMYEENIFLDGVAVVEPTAVIA